MRFFELLLLRLVLWFGVPLALAVLAVGPARIWRSIKRGWHWLSERRLDPEEILTQVVRQHEEHVAALRRALAQAETAEQSIVRNIEKSGANIAALEHEARKLAECGDDLGARAALYKLNLERLAVENFDEHLAKQRRHIEESRRRLYLLELQLRQYEVGRSILLSELAEAKTVEQQYAIANQFDPFSAVANWARAEGMVQEKAINAQAVERVHSDTADFAPSGHAPTVDPTVLDAQLADLKSHLETNRPAADPAAPPRGGNDEPRRAAIREGQA